MSIAIATNTVAASYGKKTRQVDVGTTIAEARAKLGAPATSRATILGLGVSNNYTLQEGDTALRFETPAPELG